MRCRIIVEGASDLNFIKCLVKKHFEYHLSESEILHLEGINANNDYGKIKNQLPIELSYIQDNVPLILIIDADNASNHGGFTQRKTALETIIQTFETDNGIDAGKIHLFLMPNNQEDGDLESLSVDLIPDKNNPIIDCWNAFEVCLESKTIEGRIEPLTSPNKKSMLKAYMGALLGASNNQQKKNNASKWDYLNEDYWNLDHPSLDALKAFLTPFFSINLHSN